jgi:hypothetical protein
MPTIVHQTRGRIRLRVRNDGAHAEHLQGVPDSLKNATNIRIRAAAASVVICYNPRAAPWGCNPPSAQLRH